MAGKNTLTKTEFIVEHVFWSALFWVWYKRLLFRCIPSHTFTESKLILLAMVGGVCFAGIVFQMNNGRSNTNMFLNLATAYGFYTVMAYMQINQSLIIFSLIAAGVLSFLYTLLVLCRKIQSRKKVRVIIKRIRWAAFVSKGLFGLSLVLIMAVLGINLLFGSALMKSDVRPSVQGDVQTISGNIEQIVLLEEDTWKTLTVQERLDVLQTVANIEQSYLGLSNELNVGASNLDEGMMGYYDDRSHEIIISMDSLLNDSSSVVLDTVCHEAYHSYQHRLVEVFNKADSESRGLRIFHRASSYADEFNHYVDGKKDYYSYYDQECEADAREYAEKSVLDYSYKIALYLNGES